MILKPRLLVCDEAVSALDVTVQSQIVLLLQELKRELQTSILFISHNLAVVQQLCDRVLVLYLGRMMEQGTTEALYGKPAHPYTRGLLDSVPVPDPDIQAARLNHPMPGELPSPLTPPSGCVFNTRCPHAREVCRAELPAWEAAGPDQRVACHRWREL
jgi:oligopeptide/dipeptide ABC transporter ATP-binding protein